MILGVGAAVALPYLLMGPGWLLDDFIHVRNRHFGGFAYTAKEPAWMWVARPGSGVFFTATYGTLYQHPALMYVVSVALTLGNALAFRWLLRRFVPETHAVAAAVVWLLLPIHSSTDHVGTSQQITLASLLVMLGLGWLHDRRWVHAGAVLLAGVLVYESVLPIALAGVALAALRDRDLRVGSRIGVPLIAAGAWMYVQSPKTDAARAWFDWTTLPPAHFGSAMFGGALWAGLGILAVGTILAARRRSHELAMIGAGLAVIVVGSSPYVNFPIYILGLGDRANGTSVFGTALVLTGAVMSVAGRRLLLAVAAVAVLVLPVRMERERQWAWAADESSRILGQVQPVDDQVVLEGCPIYRDNITPFQGFWDVEPAVQLYFDDPSLVGGYEQDAPVGRWSRGERCELQDARYR